MVHRDVRAAQQVRNADVARRDGGDAGERADLHDPLIEHERPGDRVENCLGMFLGAAELVWSERKRDREFVATEARDDRVGAHFIDQGVGDALQEPVPGLVAVLVVDRLEAIDLQRDDDEVLPPHRGRGAQLTRAVGKALAVVEAGHEVGGREHRGAALLLRPHLRFVLKVDVTPPPEQDQRNIQR